MLLGSERTPRIPNWINDVNRIADDYDANSVFDPPVSKSATLNEVQYHAMNMFQMLARMQARQAKRVVTKAVDIREMSLEEVLQLLNKTDKAKVARLAARLSDKNSCFDGFFRPRTSLLPFGRTA